MKYVLLLSVAALAFPAAASAEEADAEDGRTIIVTGKAVGYKAEDTATATKTDTPLLDVPQSVSVVTRAQPSICKPGYRQAMDRSQSDGASDLRSRRGTFLRSCSNMTHRPIWPTVPANWPVRSSKWSAMHPWAQELR